MPGTLRACGALGWSAEHASGTLAAHEYWAEEFLPLNKLGNRKSLSVSQGRFPESCALVKLISVLVGIGQCEGDLAKDQMGGVA